MRRRAMTLIEMVVCLAIIALCLVALVRGVGGWLSAGRGQSQRRAHQKPLPQRPAQPAIRA